MNEPNETGVIRVITCGVFKPALDYLQLQTRFPGLRIIYLESNLHLRPQELEEQLLCEFEAARQSGERMICLYGNCVAGIDDLCAEHGVTKIPGDFCHEILLGPERFRECLAETAGTYFMEKEVISKFDEHCKVPLELDDEVMRRYCFEHYHRIMYVRQPSDPDLLSSVKDIAEFLELALEIKEADYSYLEMKLVELLRF